MESSEEEEEAETDYHNPFYDYNVTCNFSKLIYNFGFNKNDVSVAEILQNNDDSSDCRYYL